jgi:hypothetical protein
LRRRSEKSAEVVVAGNREGPNEEEGVPPASLEDAMPQKPTQMELAFTGRGEASVMGRSAEASSATSGTERSGTSELMELVVTARTSCSR